MDEIKRIIIVMVLIVVVSLGLLLPLAKWGGPKRPKNVSNTAAFANGGDQPSYWIDCWDIAGGNYAQCSVYQPTGVLVLRGVFQQTAITRQRHVSYDGSAIHWKRGQTLRPVRLDCILGGKPPLVPDCNTPGSTTK